MKTRLLLPAIGALLLFVGCDSNGGVFEIKSPDIPAPINPANFVDKIDNPLFPLLPGMSWRFEVSGADEVVLVTVLEDRRDVEGVSATVVHDQAIIDGELAEDTYDWYAQDKDGNVWYLGEDTKELRDSVVVSTTGSWESGVDGARAGIYMYANPKVGDIYYQEFYRGEAEDTGEVLALNQSVTVAAGSYTGCVQTRDTTPLDPQILEHKYYCPGVGVVLAVDVAGGGVREELASFEGN